jgi:hypothetical protein
MRKPTIHSHGIISLTKWLNKKTSTKKTIMIHCHYNYHQTQGVCKKTKIENLKKLEKISPKKIIGFIKIIVT